MAMGSYLNLHTAPSPICMGTAQLGSTLGTDASFALLDTYREGGGNFLDTAHVYAVWLENGMGASERTVGAWIRSRGVRDEVIVATKGAHPDLDNMRVGRCSEKEIRSDLAESLERLGMDAVDLYWLHRDDPLVPVEEIVDTMDALLREGLLRAWGVSNWIPRRITAAIDAADRAGRHGPTANQPGWSFALRPTDPPVAGAMRFAQDEDVAWHCTHCFPMVPYSAQATGYFSQRNVAWARNGFPGNPPHGGAFDSRESRARLTRAIEVADARGCTANQLGLAWMLAQPFPVHPIVGTTRQEGVREALDAAGIGLTVGERRFLTDGSRSD